MTPKYNLVWPEFWDHARARKWTDDMEKCALYLLTCAHRELAGIYRLPIAYAAVDLGWPQDRVLDALDRLIAEDFAGYDDDAQVVLVRKAVKRLPPKSANHIRGAVNAMQRLPKTALLVDLLAAAETHAEGLAAAMREAFPTLVDGLSTDGIRPKTTLPVYVDVDRDVNGEVEPPHSLRAGSSNAVIAPATKAAA